jgi:hypothetical protein
MLHATFLSDEAWFHLTGYMKSQNTWIWSKKNPYAAHETPPHPVKIAVWCIVSRRRIAGPIFFPKTPLTRSATLIQSMNFSDISLKRKLPKHGFNKTAHVTQFGRLCASYPCCSEIESFWKESGPHDHRTWHHQLFFLWAALKTTPTAITHAMWMKWTQIPTFHPWRSKQCLRSCPTMLGYICNMLIHIFKIFCHTCIANTLLRV